MVNRMAEQNRQSMLLGKVEAYREILDENPESQVFVSLAETYRQLGMFSSAQKVISDGLKKFPLMASAHVVHARICCQLDDFDSSEGAFDAAIKLEPDNLAALVGFSRVKILLKKYDDARELLFRARKLNPADPVINKLILSLPEKRIEEPPPVQKPVTQESYAARKPLISTTLGDLYFKQGLYENALKIYRGLIDQAPDNELLKDKILQTETALAGTQHVVEEPIVTDEPAVDAALAEDVVTQEIAVEESVGVEPESDVHDTVQSVVPYEPVTDVTPPVDEPALSIEQTVTQGVVADPVTILNQWLQNIEQRRQHV